MDVQCMMSTSVNCHWCKSALPWVFKTTRMPHQHHHSIQEEGEKNAHLVQGKDGTAEEKGLQGGGTSGASSGSDQ